MQLRSLEDRVQPVYEQSLPLRIRTPGVHLPYVAELPGRERAPREHSQLVRWAQQSPYKC